VEITLNQQVCLLPINIYTMRALAKTTKDRKFCPKTEQERRDEKIERERRIIADTAYRGNPPIDNNFIKGYN
jgi:hypothetical protein